MYTHNIPEEGFIIAPVLWKFCEDSERYMMSPSHMNSKCLSQDLKASSDYVAKTLQGIPSSVSLAGS